tara:strand:- start:324 stop:560 length:237 start_codon:yes stop_codon:yes gene_type:complete
MLEENSDVIELPFEENENVLTDTSAGSCDEQVSSTTIEEVKEEVVEIKEEVKEEPKEEVKVAEIPVRKVVKRKNTYLI